jgi:hypothetical protein
VESLEGREGLVVTVLLHQPARRLVQEPHTRGQDDTRNALEGQRETPWKRKGLLV